MTDIHHAQDLARSLLIYAHLVAVLGAAIAVAFGDYAILRHPRVNRPMLLSSADGVKWALIALWITGLSVVTLDVTSAGLGVFDGPKLQAKITVVIALSLNGWLLHRFTLDRIGLPTAHAVRDARLAAALGGVSAASWMYALFLGIAKPWGPMLGYLGFVAGYLVVLGVAVAVSLRYVAPRIIQVTDPISDVPGALVRYSAAA